MIQELNLKNINIVDSSILEKDKVLNEFQHNPFAKYLVYIKEGKILGYLYYSDIYERAEINQIEVDFIHRNCGIATKLMKQFTEIVEKDTTLEVKKDNLIAQLLYKKFNFKEKAIRRGYYKGTDGILMERKCNKKNQTEVLNERVI